jgi:hypothetical protein
MAKSGGRILGMKEMNYQMATNEGTAGNASRLAILREREKELRTQIASEQTRLARRKKRDDSKEHFIVGRELVGNAAKSPEFRLMLSQVLTTSLIDDRERRFLAARGWF